MAVFLSLFTRLIPLLTLVVFGFIAGRYLKVHRESIAKLLIYLVAPVVFFSSVSQIELRPEYLFVPVMFYGLGCAICWLYLRIGGKVFGEAGALKNLAAFSMGTANTGYFGLPVAMMLFGPDIAGVAILFFVGSTIFENSYGFYVLARGQYTPWEALQRLTKLPGIYALAAGVALNPLHLKFTGVWADMAGFFRGTYSVLGMMMVGLGVAEVREWKIDGKLIATLFSGKFLVWPAVVIALVSIDAAHFRFYDARSHQLMILLSACPLAANTVAFSILLKTEPEKAAVAVLLSTLFALAFIPAVVSLFPAV